MIDIISKGVQKAEKGGSDKKGAGGEPATLSVAGAIKNGQALTNVATDPTVNGASSGVSSVSYSDRSGGGCTPGTSLARSSTGPSYSVTWSSQPADGTYRVQAVVTDAAGNTAASNIVSTTVDNTAPASGPAQSTPTATSPPRPSRSASRTAPTEGRASTAPRRSSNGPRRP